MQGFSLMLSASKGVIGRCWVVRLKPQEDTTHKYVAVAVIVVALMCDAHSCQSQSCRQASYQQPIHPHPKDTAHLKRRTKMKEGQMEIKHQTLCNSQAAKLLTYILKYSLRQAGTNVTSFTRPTSCFACNSNNKKCTVINTIAHREC